jgi:2-desacetyl-2-hydroxyethyl bacteriochlorophyllide A dehydrogenase
MQASAAVAVQPGQIVFEIVSIPDPTPDDVVVRVHHSWISPGTERSFVLGERINGETPRGPRDPLPFPHVSGYQKVGIIEWVGSAAPSHIHIGDKVFATVSKIEDMFFPYGGHISPAVTHHSQIWTLPDTPSSVAFSGLVLTQVGYNCATRFPISLGDPVVVIGDGLIGQWASQLLIHRGARVMLIGKHDERLAYFVPSADNRRVNSTLENAVMAAQEWATAGVHAVIDTVGSVETLEAFMPIMRHDGHLVSAGFNGVRGMLDIQHLRFRELSLHSPSGWTKPRMDATLGLVARGVLQTEPLITHRFPAAQAREAFDVILSRSEPFLGVVLDWEDQAE